MGLLSFFRRDAGADAAPRARRAIPPRDPATLENLRHRARRRLLGAAVLVVLAVVLIPWVLDSAPRPPEQWAGDVRVSPSARVSSDRSSGPVVREAAPAVAAAAVVAAAAAKSATVPAPAASKTDAPKGVVKPRESEKVAAKDEKKVEIKKPEVKKPEAKKPDSEISKSSRYVVQAGAYGDMEAAQAVRDRISKLGLHSVYNTTDTPTGKRVRVRLGPFNRKEDADKAAAKLRAGGLGATVLTWESSR